MALYHEQDCRLVVAIDHLFWQRGVHCSFILPFLNSCLNFGSLSLVKHLPKKQSFPIIPQTSHTRDHTAHPTFPFSLVTPLYPPPVLVSSQTRSTLGGTSNETYQTDGPAAKAFTFHLFDVGTVIGEECLARPLLMEIVASPLFALAVRTF